MAIWQSWGRHLGHAFPFLGEHQANFEKSHIFDCFGAVFPKNAKDEVKRLKGSPATSRALEGPQTSSIYELYSSDISTFELEEKQEGEDRDG